MEHARLNSLLVVALLQLCQTEISSNTPETWFAANVISDDNYSIKPISEIFTTEATFSSTNPIVVLSGSSTTRDPDSTTSSPISTSTRSTTFETTTSTETPTTEGLSAQPQSVFSVSSVLPPIPTIIFGDDAAIQTTQPTSTPSPRPQSTPLSTQSPPLIPQLQFQQPPISLQLPQLQFQQPPTSLQLPQLQFQQPPISLQIPQIQFQLNSTSLQLPQLQFQQTSTPPPQPQLQFQQTSTPPPQPQLQFQQTSTPPPKPQLQFQQPSTSPQPQLQFQQPCTSPQPQLQFQQPSTSPQPQLQFQQPSTSPQPQLQFQQPPSSLQSPQLQFQQTPTSQQLPQLQFQQPSTPPTQPQIQFQQPSTSPQPQIQFQQSATPPSPPPILLSSQQIGIQTPSQVPQIQGQPPNFFVMYQQMPQNVQNPLNLTQLTPFIPPQTIIATSPPQTAFPTVTSTVAPCATNTPIITPQSQNNIQSSTFRIRMVVPSGSVTSVRLNDPSITMTTGRIKTTRTPKRNRNTFDSCVNGCGARAPICASPTVETTIDPDNLKGFPSVCHMACHNSFRKTIYEKVADGKCSRLRTRIRPIDSNKLKRDELNKATYTIVQSQPSVVEISPLNS